MNLFRRQPNLQQAMQAADYVRVVAILNEELQRNRDPGKLFMSLQYQVILEEFDDAIDTLNRILEISQDPRIEAEFRSLIENARSWCNRQKIPGCPKRALKLAVESPAYVDDLYDAAQAHARGEHALAKELITKRFGTQNSVSSEAAGQYSRLRAFFHRRLLLARAILLMVGQ